MAKQRTEKINGELQKCIYEVISRRLKNPNLTEMVSVTRVETTDDLKFAKVYVSIYSTDAERKKNTFDAVKSAAGFIRHEIASMMMVRTVPSLNFIEDNNMEYSMHISALIDQVRPDKAVADSDEPETMTQSKEKDSSGLI